MPQNALRTITTNIPARLDRLPWSAWHWRILVGLGTVWILDGLEVTIVGSLSQALQDPKNGLALSSGDIGMAGAVYVAGACLGALFFGHLTDRIGRKKLFMGTLVLYTAATVLTAFSMNPVWYFACRFFTGAGIGGEYAAINSAIDELIPAKYRGNVDIVVNGTYWLGAMFGALLTVFLLDPTKVDQSWGWRAAFGLGALLALVILVVRRHVPESPRWLFIHGRDDEAEDVVTDIEHHVETQRHERLENVGDDETITIKQRHSITFAEIAHTAFTRYPKRTVLCLALFVGQAFLYNAFFFTYGDALGTLLHVEQAGWYIAAFALSNFAGALLLGRLFDTIGRRIMITATYVISGVLLVVVAFFLGSFSAVTLTAAGCVTFFFASAGTSSAYLTASEIFPMETRAMAIAFFYAVGTAVGGIAGPLYFGKLIEGADSISAMAPGYWLGGALMIGAGILEIFLGVDSEQQSLEDIAAPLSAQES
ncbi:MFS transporter [Dermacoccus sp. PE3]|uniref:MFS transporter n=1 Tax=Dermacoccus sp. PE3 TaxID=1641401 RepID=UPI0006424B5D|nr:MFS transporter [Dermacoccus sp. PE3]KLO62738.1 MFS transporter [Dermacoccus sp. PE3]